MRILSVPHEGDAESLAWFQAMGRGGCLAQRSRLRPRHDLGHCGRAGPLRRPPPRAPRSRPARRWPHAEGMRLARSRARGGAWRGAGPDHQVVSGGRRNLARPAGGPPLRRVEGAPPAVDPVPRTDAAGRQSPRPSFRRRAPAGRGWPCPTCTAGSASRRRPWAPGPGSEIGLASALQDVRRRLEPLDLRLLPSSRTPAEGDEREQAWRGGQVA
jgi:hypothetical protein